MNKKTIWKDTAVWNTLISKSGLGLSEVHSNLGTSGTVRWAAPVSRSWCQPHLNPQQLHCSNGQRSRYILMRLKSQTCLLLRSCFGLFYIHPIESELRLPAIPFPLDWFPWKQNLCSLRITDFSLAKICQALFFWKLSGSSCIPQGLYPLAEIGSNTHTFFGRVVGGQEHSWKNYWLVNLHVIFGRCAFCWNKRLKQEQHGLWCYMVSEISEGLGMFAQQ